MKTKKLQLNLSLLLPLAFMLGCCPLLRAQSAKEVFDVYKRAVASVQTISYTVSQVDTFFSGEKRNITGNCLIRREPDNKLIGCVFVGKRLDMPVTHWYDGQDFYAINDGEKSYVVNHTPGKSILGSVGGQMLCSEFIQPDDDFTKLSLSDLPDYFVLRLDLPDLKQYNAHKRYKILYIDKTTFLPQRIETSQQTKDKHQITIKTFSGVYVNDPLTALDLNKKDAIKFYKMTESEQKDEEERPAAPSVWKKGKRKG